MFRPLLLLSLIAGLSLVSAAGPFGLAKVPPMGWRTWTAYTSNVDQTKMESVMDKMTERTRMVDGKPTSLADLGFIDIGLDDGWQACGKGVNGSFHDKDGNPIINTALFPSMLNMTRKAHAAGLTASWYMNNCICYERNFNEEFVQLAYRQNVASIVDNEFDGVKVDGCSVFNNITVWALLLNATGRPVEIENAHDDIAAYPSDPNTVCPFNWFRSSGDAWRDWPGVFKNFLTVLPFLGADPLSRPSCFAYPDMMQVGNFVGDDAFLQDRAHFGAWCIVSSPLILSYDILNEAITNSIWPIISNQEAIAVNQNWFGSPRLVSTVATPVPPVRVGNLLVSVPCDPSDVTQQGFLYNNQTMAMEGPGSTCLDASNTTQLHLSPCSGSASQHFKLVSLNGPYKVCSASDSSSCVTASMSQGYPGGPAIGLVEGGQGMEASWQLQPSTRTVEEIALKRCWAARDVLPLPAGNLTQFMVFAKPQANDSVAVFVLSNTVPTPAAVSFSLADIGFTPSASSAHVRDIWSQADLPDVTDGHFTTDVFGSIDSRFYLFHAAE